MLRSHENRDFREVSIISFILSKFEKNITLDFLAMFFSHGCDMCFKMKHLINFEPRQFLTATDRDLFNFDTSSVINVTVRKKIATSRFENDLR